MIQARPSDSRVDLLQGTLDMLILRTLQWGPQHGYAIGQTIRAQSADVLRVEAGSLYPALQRLNKRGWVTAKWDITEANQRARFYRLTPAGKKQLIEEQSRWGELVAAIGRILNPVVPPVGSKE
jgi:transcriptional regulator